MAIRAFFAIPVVKNDRLTYPILTAIHNKGLARDK